MFKKTFNLVLFGMIVCVAFLLFTSIGTCEASGDSSQGNIMISIIGVIALLTVFIMSGIYMYKDAKERGTSGLPWLVIGLLTGILGLIVWLVLRPSHSSKKNSFHNHTERPDGITILAVLEGISGFYTLVTGIFLIPVLFLLREISRPSSSHLSIATQSSSSSTHVDFTILLIALGIIVVVLATLHFMLAYGFWKGRKWGWKLGIIFPIVGIIGSIIIYIVSSELGILVSIIPSVIIGLIVVFYLTRPHVKAYFKKS